MPNIQPSSRLQRPWRSCLHDPEGDHAFDGMSKGASSLARASMDRVDAPYARDRASMDAVLAPRPCTRASMDAACGRESTTRTSMAFVLPRSRRNRACAVSKNEPARRVLASMDGVDAAARSAVADLVSLARANPRFQADLAELPHGPATTTGVRLKWPIELRPYNCAQCGRMLFNPLCMACGHQNPSD